MEKHGIDTNRRPKEILPDLQEAYKSSKGKKTYRRNRSI